MKLKIVGVVLIVAVVLAVGEWFLYQGLQSKRPRLTTTGATAEPSVAPATGVVDIPFIITAAKKDWVQEEVDLFNHAHEGQWRVTTSALPSRQAMHDILSGKEKPVMWSPGSPIWPARLQEAWGEKTHDKILDLADPTAYRVYLRSPLVFVTTVAKLPFLRPRLGGQKPWTALRRLSMGQDKVPWGTFRFSHADPVNSSSGILTVGLMLEEFATDTGQTGALDKASDDPRFTADLKDMEHSLVYDGPAEAGTTALAKSFFEDRSRYDVITAYESAALEAAPRLPDVAVIYPNPTFVAEHAISLLSGPWVTEGQRQGATAFLTFLGSKEALQNGMKYHFRPAQGGGSLSLGDELSKYQAQGFQQSFTTAELPPYKALNGAAFRWRVDVMHKSAGEL